MPSSWAGQSIPSEPSRMTLRRTATVRARARQRDARTPAQFFRVVRAPASESRCHFYLRSRSGLLPSWTPAAKAPGRACQLSCPSAAQPRASDHPHPGRPGRAIGRGPRQQVRKGCPPLGLVQQTPAVHPTRCPPSCPVPPTPTRGRWPGLSALEASPLQHSGRQPDLAGRPRGWRGAQDGQAVLLKQQPA